MWKLLLIGLIQGITEFLPVSSSGHMVLIEKLLKFNPPGIGLEIWLHGATLLSVLVYFRKDILNLLNFKQKENLKLWGYLIIASVPAGIVGIFFKDVIEKAFESYHLLALTYALTSLVLFSYYFAIKRSVVRELDFLRAFFIGIFQAIAILPGVSRSGMTITSGRWAGLSDEKAFRFSFYLFLIAGGGAFLLELKELRNFVVNSGYLLSFIIAFLSGYLMLGILRRIVVNQRFYLFGFYTLFLAIILAST